MLALSAVSSTYAAAQVIVAALERNDENSWTEAFAKFSEFAGPEIGEVADKSIALGADPSTIETLIAAIQPTEVIEVTGQAPVLPVATRSKPIPWLWILLGLLAVGGTVYYVRKRRKRPA